MSEEKHCMDMDDVVESGENLRKEISSVGCEYQEILDNVTAAEKEKTKAKERYNRCIDAGNESGMKECLKTIRECNQRMETLSTSREIFFQKLPALDTKYNLLIEAAREKIRGFEKAVKKAEKDLQDGKIKLDRLRVISSEIGKLRDIIVRSGSEVVESEDKV